MLKQDLILQINELGRPLPRGKNTKVIGFVKDVLREKYNDKVCCVDSKNI